MEDPSFRVSSDPDSGQTLLSGMGELHLEIIQDRILTHYKVGAQMGKIQISYKTSIAVPQKVTHGLHYAQGGRNVDVSITLSLNPQPGKGLSFRTAQHESDQDKPTMNKISHQDMISALQEGYERSCSRGYLGYPLIDMEATLEDFSAPLSELSLPALRKCIGQLINKLVNEHVVFLEPFVSLEVRFTHINFFFSSKCIFFFST